ncbi:membrane-associated tyrosine- and threonine-specific cdc2-inhibitory kinase [Episyrphus balteatus]|uniref:membrane-associated tyrosine- and threonine-specific cdc2-inhibitory kinase n=1 Tax=Episyrphus balteatus TaxID=286459 RepID=UPI0024853059|nr:membrane-associated tyrosine- and threonine-specific cdc2-inhibitory kinase [Episyrphus balteatus]
MTSKSNGSYLPVPEIREDTILQHSYKSNVNKEDPFRMKPPKLKPRYHDFNLNRSQNSLSAHAISFKEASGLIVSDSLLSPVYNRSSEETYFEQCFTKISKIGEGSFGEVFKVRSKEDGLLYAVKKSKQFFRSENYRHERLEEVKRYEQFSDHENCVRLYKAWEQDDRLYMQMELCQESLDHYLGVKKRIPEEKIWSILLDLLLAVKSLHDKNLIHLDIKLDNVLIGDDGICKLADFGLVIDVDRANRHEATEGDSRYIAPELMQGHFSRAADIFSLGIAMLELSSYIELPPNGPLWQELRSGILPEDFIKPISPELKQMIKSMMTPDAMARPTVDELLRNRKLVNLLQRRRRWDLIRKVKQSYRKSRRAVWSKLCNFRNFICRFLFSLITNLKLKEPPTTDIRTTTTTTTTGRGDNNLANMDNSFAVENSFEISYNQATPTHFGDAAMKIVNSTPLNHHHQSFRSRKDLTKTSFRLDSTDTKQESSNILSFEDYDIAPHSVSLVRNQLDVSSLRGKKLFSKADDSDSD